MNVVDFEYNDKQIDSSWLDDFDYEYYINKIYNNNTIDKNKIETKDLNTE